jgi:hypothetical protein
LRVRTKTQKNKTFRNKPFSKRQTVANFIIPTTKAATSVHESPKNSSKLMFDLNKPKMTLMKISELMNFEALKNLKKNAKRQRISKSRNQGR